MSAAFVLAVVVATRANPMRDESERGCSGSVENRPVEMQLPSFLETIKEDGIIDERYAEEC